MQKHDLVTKATYSPEDNKLRIYCVPEERFDTETYEQVKDARFRWAPIQKLWFAHWSPKAEDLCIALAGDIEPEEKTLVERSEAKAERLKALAEKRANDAIGFARAAQQLSSEMGNQPVLLGHHSQRKIEKNKERVERNQEKSEKAASAVRYWNWKMMGAIHHAERKNRWDVVARRIQTLLTDLRKQQSFLNDGAKTIEFWTMAKGKADPKAKFAMAYKIANYRWDLSINDCYSALRECLSEDNEIINQERIDQIIDENIRLGERRFNNQNTRRRVIHLLNRLEYERAQLGEVSKFSGQLRPTQIQVFLRTHGAEKPKAEKTDYGIAVECDTPLPVHIGEGSTLELSNDEWCSLMQEVGYEVPAEKPKKPSILNLSSEKVERIKVNHYRRVEALEVVPLTKAEYSKVYKDYRGTRLSECGTFRVKICHDPRPAFGEAPYGRDWVIAHLTDSKEHKLPDSESLILKEPVNA